MRLYLDASAIIYAIEGVAPFRDSVVARIAQAEGVPGGIVITSRLSRLECRVKTLREGNAEVLAKFDGFFSKRQVSLSEISPAVVERATELRARYAFKTPDAIHLASAIEEQADLFLTGDTDLGRCVEVTVEVLTP
jgi:predicted nucleic acid-binding protein